MEYVGFLYQESELWFWVHTFYLGPWTLRARFWAILLLTVGVQVEGSDTVLLRNYVGSYHSPVEGYPTLWL